MGILYITEYVDVARALGADNPIAQEPGVDQTVTYGATTQSTVFKNNTTVVRIHNDATSPCSINFGTNPTATTANKRLAGNQTEYFGVPLGGAYKVAAITNT